MHTAAMVVPTFNPNMLQRNKIDSPLSDNLQEAKETIMTLYLHLYVGAALQIHLQSENTIGGAVPSFKCTYTKCYSN
jgi:hypothetical protein